MAKFVPELTLLINGTSKSHAMTGWRSAFLAGPADLINSIYPLHQSVLTAISTQIQYASIEAYDNSDAEIQRMLEDYQARRDFLIEGLSELEYDFIIPEGAFYLFSKIPAWYEGDDYQFCLDLAHEVKIGVTPAQIFGEAGRGHFRISYVSSMANLKTLLEQLKAFETSYKEKKA